MKAFYFKCSTGYLSIPNSQWASPVVQWQKNPPAHAGDAGGGWFHSWVRKMPWRRKWQPTPVFLLGKSHGQRSLVGYSS